MEDKEIWRYTSLIMQFCKQNNNKKMDKMLHHILPKEKWP